jgi:hypothetical protein
MNRALLSGLTLTVMTVFSAIPASLAQKASRPSPEITVGATKLGIGMGKDKVVSLLAQNGFQVVPVGNNTTAEKPERIKMLTFLKEPREVVEVAFGNGKVIRVSKPIDFQSSDEALESIYGLIAKFQESGHAVCRVDAKMNADGERTIKTATINCMLKFIEITVMRNNAGEVRLMNIAEGISDTP